MDKNINSNQVAVKLASINERAIRLNITTESLVGLILLHVNRSETVLIDDTLVDSLFDEAISYFVYNYRTNPEGFFVLLNKLYSN